MYPALIAGQRANPLEDVGGVWGYENFLEAIQDPEHPSYDTFSDWIDIDSFDPDEMEADSIRMRLASLVRFVA